MRPESFGQGLFDHNSPVGTRNGSSGSGNLVAPHVPACCETRSRAADRIAYGLEGLGCRFVRSAQDQADVRMSNEPTRSVQHEGEAGLSHFDGRYHVPN